MSEVKTKFNENKSVEAFIAEKGIFKIYFQGMFKKGSQDPAYYNDKDGNPTEIQRVAIRADRHETNRDTGESVEKNGETVAFLSQELAEKWWKDNNSLAGEKMQFVDCETSRVNPETSDIETVRSWWLCREVPQGTDMSAIFGL